MWFRTEPRTCTDRHTHNLHILSRRVEARETSVLTMAHPNWHLLGGGASFALSKFGAERILATFGGKTRLLGEDEIVWEICIFEGTPFWLEGQPLVSYVFRFFWALLEKTPIPCLEALVEMIGMQYFALEYPKIYASLTLVRGSSFAGSDFFPSVRSPFWGVRRSLESGLAGIQSRAPPTSRVIILIPDPLVRLGCVFFGVPPPSKQKGTYSHQLTYGTCRSPFQRDPSPCQVPAVTIAGRVVVLLVSFKSTMFKLQLFKQNSRFPFGSCPKNRHPVQSIGVLFGCF